MVKRPWPRSINLATNGTNPTNSRDFTDGARAKAVGLFVTFVKFVVELGRSPDCPGVRPPSWSQVENSLDCPAFYAFKPRPAALDRRRLSSAQDSLLLAKN